MRLENINGNPMRLLATGRDRPGAAHQHQKRGDSGARLGLQRIGRLGEAEGGLVAEMAGQAARRQPGPVRPLRQAALDGDLDLLRAAERLYKDDDDTRPAS